MNRPPEKLQQVRAGRLHPGIPDHQFNSQVGVKLNGIAYKSAAPAAAAGGETQMMFTSSPTIVGMVRAGRLRLLAVTSAQRSSAAPEVSTVSESGLPGFVFSEWYGVVAPQGPGRHGSAD